MAKKLLALLLAALTMCTVFGFAATAEDSQSVQYNCNFTLDDDIIGYTEAFTDAEGNPESRIVTIVKPGDTIKFSSSGSFVASRISANISYYPDVDAVYASDYASLANKYIGEDALLIKDPGNLAKSEKLVKRFAHEYGRGKLANTTYTVLGIGQTGEVAKNIEWKSYDSAGIALKPTENIPLDYKLTIDGQEIAFLGWVMSVATYKSSTIAISFYALWDKPQQAKLCACGDICFCDCACTDTECKCHDGCGCQCSCTQNQGQDQPDPDKPGEESGNLIDYLTPVDPEGKNFGERLAAYFGKIAGVITTLLNLIKLFFNTAILENLRDILYAWTGISEYL